MSVALEALALGLADALTPLRIALEEEASFPLMLRGMGFELELAVGPFHETAPLDAVHGAIVALEQAARSLGTQSTVADDVVACLEAAEATLAAIDALRPPTSVGALPASLRVLDWGRVADALPAWLIIERLRQRSPILYAALDLLGVMRFPKGGPPELDWAALGSLVSDPLGHLVGLYGWTLAGWERLRDALLRALSALGAPVRVHPLRPSIVEDWFGGADPGLRELELTIVEGLSAQPKGYVVGGLILAPVPTRSGTRREDVDGLLLTNLTWGASALPLDLGGDWALHLGAGLDATGALGVSLGPRGADFQSFPAELDAGLRVVGAPTSPWRLLGSEDGARVELGGAELYLEATGSSAAPELRAGLRLQELRFALDLSEADGFLRGLLAGVDLDARASLELSWSSAQGLRLAGQPGLSATLPLGLALGPFTLQTLDVELGPGEGLARLSGRLSGSVDLSIFSVSVDGIGLSIDITEKGSAAPGLGLGLLPPLGLGVSLSTEVVGGGGYLDPSPGGYSGVLELSFAGFSLAALGVLDTGPGDDWSLFFSIFMDTPPIPLGFGITLSAAGGLIAVNRALDAEALRQGIREQSLDHVLFPEDPVGDAPAILTAMDAIFPPSPGSVVVGPMLQVRWGPGGRVVGELGALISLPDPPQVAVLGTLTAALPSPERELIGLRLDAAGILDVGAGSLSVSASLFDSQLVGLSLSGDMELRAQLTGEPSFLLSVGGFNPRFDPPAGFPELRRLSAGLDLGEDLHLGLSCYFALTSNTVQFGGRVDIWARALGFTVEGYASADVLVQLLPFGFVADIGCGVAVSKGDWDLLAVDLAASVSGPAPWHAQGKACFRFLGKEIKLKVEARVGDDPHEPAPEGLDVALELERLLALDESWRALPPQGPPPALLRDGGSAAAHPAGRLEVRQSLVPLDTDIERFGELPPPQARYSLSAALDVPVEQAPVEDWFAPASFFARSEAKRLSGPSFERMPAGLSFGGGGLSTEESALRRPLELGHEEERVDPALEAKEASRFKALSPEQLPVSLQRGAGFQATLRSALGGPRGGGAFGVAPTAWVPTDKDGAPVGPAQPYSAAERAGAEAGGGARPACFVEGTP